MGESNIRRSIEMMMSKGYIQEAFERVICKKIRVDGYVDISAYSYMSCDENVAQKVHNMIHLPRYIRLVKNENHLSNDLSKIYQEYVITQQETERAQFDIDILINEICKCHVRPEHLSPLQAEAIVDITMSQVPLNDRAIFFKQMFDLIRNELKGRSTPCDSQPYHDGEGTNIWYDSSSIEIKPISSVSDMIKNANVIHDHYKYCEVHPAIFYRGHEQVNYILQPKVMRTEKNRKNERTIFQEMMIACPDDLVPRRSHMEKLALMQHYMLPTRLLDVSRNPLVALYMATNGSYEHTGEIFVLAPEANMIKYHDSDIVSVLSSLALFEEDEKKDLYKLVEDTISKYCDPNCKNRHSVCEVNSCKLRDDNYEGFEEFNKNRIVHRLVHEVRSEKPGFLAEIVPCQLLKKYFVHALKDSARIIRQDGAFILSGLDVSLDKKTENKNGVTSVNDFKFTMPIGQCNRCNKTLVFIIPSQYKEKIKKELDCISINHQTLMPDIADVASELTSKYC